MRIRVADLVVAGGGVALTTVAVLMWATRLEVRAAQAASRLAEIDARQTAAKATLAERERRAGEDAALRQAVVRRVEELRSRCPARPSDAIGEASRARPNGVWLTRLCWAGAEVKAEGRSWGPAPATEFAGRLARSPRFAQVFAAPAAAEPAGPARFLLFARAVGR